MLVERFEERGVGVDVPVLPQVNMISEIVPQVSDEVVVIGKSFFAPDVVAGIFVALPAGLKTDRVDRDIVFSEIYSFFPCCVLLLN